MKKKKRAITAPGQGEKLRKSVERKRRLWARAEQGDAEALMILGRELLGQKD